METVLIVIHLMLVAALIALVLLQRSEGGALGIGGGGNFMTGRSSGNILTRTTGYLAVGFFATSIALTILAEINAAPTSLIDTVGTGEQERPEGGGLLELLGGGTPAGDEAAPAEETAAPVAETPADVPTDSGEAVAPAVEEAPPEVPTDAGADAAASANEPVQPQVPTDQ